MTRCSLVAGAVATGAPLTDAERAHVAGCPDCAALVALPSAIARTARAAEPGVGFAARMQVGARARITARRRRRIAVSVVASMAAAVAIFFGAQRLQRVERADRPLGSYLTRPISPEESSRARDLLERARLDRAMRPAGPWQEIEAPFRTDRKHLVQVRLKKSGGSR